MYQLMFQKKLLLDLHEDKNGEIIIPEAVYKELSVKKESVCKKEADRSLSWIQVHSIRNQMAKAVYKTQLHDGEVEVMILSKEIGADVEGFAIRVE